MVKESLLEYKKLEVRKTDEPDDDILRLLEEAVIGAEGGMQYSMQKIPEKIRAYGRGISFLALYKKDILSGVIGLCHRRTITGSVEYDSTHVRYLTFRSAFQTVTNGLSRREHSSHLQESFKHRVLSMLSRPLEMSDSHEEPTGKHVMYAYVESKNERSKNLINQAGYEYIRSFLTVAFSRFSPKKDAAVTRLAADEIPAMSTRLRDYYSDHSFYSDEFFFYNNNYYVLREDGKIIAGLCAIPTSYRIVNMPGVWGWIMMKLMPHAPYFRRLFRPGEFHYLVLSAIYCTPGREDELPRLFGAVCAEEGYHTALTWLDDRSALFDSLHTNGRMGALNRILNAKPGLVYASFSNFTDSEKEPFYDSPVYISGFDFS